MHSNDKRDVRSRAGFWVALTIGLLLAYPLSFGPVMWLAQYVGVLNPIVGIVYYPLGWLLYENELFHYLMALYLSLWGIEI